MYPEKPRFDIHVFLGPTLDIKTAKKYLSNAHYHPPIQCGDLMRLLRLQPRVVVIIDGLYETVPAVWHKEILMMLHLGISVWGAASMGALRASELHMYGMKGIGEIYNYFKQGVLEDDDEVAVLHKSAADHYEPLSDAMINIRTTIKKAQAHDVISETFGNSLISYCKKQFYQQRQLMSAIHTLSICHKDECEKLIHWISLNGLIDQKRTDAITALKTVKLEEYKLDKPKNITKATVPMTHYVSILFQYCDSTPFSHNRDWLPKIELDILKLSQNKKHFFLVSSIALLLKRLDNIQTIKNVPFKTSHFVASSHQNLYSPEDDFQYIKNHPTLSSLYKIICQNVFICSLKNETIACFLPSVAAFFQMNDDSIDHVKPLLKIVFVLTLVINTQLQYKNIQLTKNSISALIKRIAFARGFTEEEIKLWLQPANIDCIHYQKFLALYIQCFIDNNAVQNKLPHYFLWIYDAYKLYKDLIFQQTITCN